MTQSKYIVYKCDTCDRETEILLDAKRPDPVRCNITNKCRGALLRVGSRVMKKTLFTPIVPGLQDYIQRGTKLSTTATEAPVNQVSLFTGENMLTVALLKKRTSGSNIIFYTVDEVGRQFDLENLSSSYTLPQTTELKLRLYEISPNVISYKKYTFNSASALQVLRGEDSSTERKNLRFTSSDSVNVYVNGVELEETEFDRSVDNVITFTPQITGTDNIADVIVYDTIDNVINQDDLITLTFRPLVPTVAADLAKRNLNCWGDFGGVRINDLNDTDRYCLYCTNISGSLSANKSYGVAWANVKSTLTGKYRKIDPNELFFLLGSEPYSTYDKDVYAYVTGYELITSEATISYRTSQATGNRSLCVAEDHVTQRYHPIKGLVPVTLTDTSATQDTVKKADNGLTRKYIIGPR